MPRSMLSPVLRKVKSRTISPCSRPIPLSSSVQGVPSQVPWEKPHLRLSCFPSVVKSTSRNAENHKNHRCKAGLIHSTQGPWIRQRWSCLPMPQAGSHRAVFLVGFMGAGKSSVGRSLARRLGWSFEDLDDRIEAHARRSVPEIFRDLGETEFRRLETTSLRELLSELGAGPRVVALGGGAFAQPENAALLEHAGVPVIFLDGSAEELFRRCEQERRGRPLL